MARSTAVLVDRYDDAGHRAGKDEFQDTPGVHPAPMRQIRILGVPLDLGQSRRGVDMGPSAMRVAGLAARLEALGYTVTDGGNIAVAIAETKSFGEANARYLHEITDTCTKAAEAVGQGP
jgi:arginase